MSIIICADCGSRNLNTCYICSDCGHDNSPRLTTSAAEAITIEGDVDRKIYEDKTGDRPYRNQEEYRRDHGGELPHKAGWYPGMF